MATPRKHKVDLSDTSVYHVVSTCVRHTWLCGYDAKNNKHYEHRRRRIVARMHYLASGFFIDLLEHNVLSNHYHVLLDIAAKQASKASREEVVERYYSVSLAQGYKAVYKWYYGYQLTQAEYDKAMQDIEFFRERLTSLSWFMQKLNQPIAKEANAEDNMQGSRFWEGRYYSRGVRSSSQMIKCMIYIALNKVHANMISQPELDEHTGLFERLNQQLTDSQTLLEQGLPEFKNNRLAQYNIPVNALQPFLGHESADDERGIPFSFVDYCTLVDSIARIKRDDKSGHLDSNAQSILQRLGLPNPRDSLLLLSEIESFDPLYYTKAQRDQAKQLKHLA